MAYKVFNVPAFDETYEIIGELGTGGGAVVYKAFHKRLRKYVVVKQIKDKIKDKVDVRGEADILKRLHHTYLPQVYDFIIVGNDYYTVIDFVDGSSFDNLIKAGQSFSQGSIVKWAAQLCEALRYLHANKILHSDIKPANVMLTPAGDVCLIDFNISLAFEHSARAIGQSAGYAPPELYVRPSQGQQATEPVSGSIGSNYYKIIPGQIDPRSDIYSLGATLYHMATGRRPSVATQPTVPLEQYNPDISDGLKYIIEKAMLPDPAQRFQSADEMLRALQNIVFLDGEYKKKNARQVLAVAVIATLAAAFSILAMFGWRQVRLEDRDRYDDYIAQAYAALEQFDYPEAERLSVMAQSLMEKEPEAYYVNAQAIYKSGEYKMCAMYILEHLDIGFPLHTDINKQLVADLYYVLGNCYLELGKAEHSRLSEAEEAFAAATDLYDGNPDYYRDAAIAAIYNNRPSVAKELMQQAESKGLAQASILLIQGEIARAEGDYTGAVTQLRNAAQASDKAELKLRAYFAAADIYEKDRQDLPNAITVLEQARKDAVLSENLGLIERLGLLYSKAAAATERDDYYRLAISCYEKIVGKGRGTMTMMYNVSVMYRVIGDFENAKRWLLQMNQQYPGNYKTFLQLANIEIEEQEFKPFEQRSYQAAYGYHQQAAALYPQRENREPDYEMETLDELIRDFKAYGWN